jgi:hypothetical protein
LNSECRRFKWREGPGCEPGPSLANEVAVEFGDVDRRQLARAQLRDQVPLDDRFVALPGRPLQVLRVRIGREPLARERRKRDRLELPPTLLAHLDAPLLERLLRPPLPLRIVVLLPLTGGPLDGAALSLGLLFP